MTSTFPYNGIISKTLPETYSNKSWSTRLIKALKIAKSDFVFLCLDDFYFTKTINDMFINHAIEVIKNDKHVKCIILHDFPPSSKLCKTEYDHFFCVKDNTLPFTINAQFAIWRKKYLLKLLHNGESAWQFEELGTIRNRFYNKMILYRKDFTDNFAYYPLGGVMGLGKFRLDDLEVVQALSDCSLSTETPYTTPPHKMNKEKGRLFILKRIYRKLYKNLSAIIPFLPYI